MKPNLKKTLLYVALLWSYASASAYDFEIDGIYYNVLSLNDMTCEVTYNPEMRSEEKIEYYCPSFIGSIKYTYPSYKGDITIPKTVNYKGREFTVTQIGEYAFLNCRNLKSLTLPSSIISFECPKINNIYGYPSEYSSSPFDYCKIQKYTICNSFVLQRFDEPSFIYDQTYKTSTNLKKLCIAEEFNNPISIDFKKYVNLTSIECKTECPPDISSSVFSNSQYIGMQIKVPNEQIPEYKKNNSWNLFWNLVSIESGTESPSVISTTFIDNDITYDIPRYNKNECCIISINHGDTVILPEKVNYLGRELKITNVKNLTTEKINSISIPPSITLFSASINTNGDLATDNSIVIPYISSSQLKTLKIPNRSAKL